MTPTALRSFAVAAVAAFVAPVVIYMATAASTPSDVLADALSKSVEAPKPAVVGTPVILQPQADGSCIVELASSDYGPDLSAWGYHLVGSTVAYRLSNCVQKVTNALSGACVVEDRRPQRVREAHPLAAAACEPAP